MRSFYRPHSFKDWSAVQSDDIILDGIHNLLKNENSIPRPPLPRGPSVRQDKISKESNESTTTNGGDTSSSSSKRSSPMDNAPPHGGNTPLSGALPTAATVKPPASQARNSLSNLISKHPNLVKGNSTTTKPENVSIQTGDISFGKSEQNAHFADQGTNTGDQMTSTNTGDQTNSGSVPRDVNSIAAVSSGMSGSCGSDTGLPDGININFDRWQRVDPVPPSPSAVQPVQPSIPGPKFRSPRYSSAFMSLSRIPPELLESSRRSSPIRSGRRASSPGPGRMINEFLQRRRATASGGDLGGEMTRGQHGVLGNPLTKYLNYVMGDKGDNPSTSISGISNATGERKDAACSTDYGGFPYRASHLNSHDKNRYHASRTVHGDFPTNLRENRSGIHADSSEKLTKSVVHRAMTGSVEGNGFSNNSASEAENDTDGWKKVLGFARRSGLTRAEDDFLTTLVGGFAPMGVVATGQKVGGRKYSDDEVDCSSASSSTFKFYSNSESSKGFLPTHAHDGNHGDSNQEGGSRSEASSKGFISSSKGFVGSSDGRITHDGRIITLTLTKEGWRKCSSKRSCLLDKYDSKASKASTKSGSKSTSKDTDSHNARHTASKDTDSYSVFSFGNSKRSKESINSENSQKDMSSSKGVESRPESSKGMSSSEGIDLRLDSSKGMNSNLYSSKGMDSHLTSSKGMESNNAEGNQLFTTMKRKQETRKVFISMLQKLRKLFGKGEIELSTNSKESFRRLLKALIKILRNIMENPRNPKFRKFNFANLIAKVQIGGMTPALDSDVGKLTREIFFLLGWVDEENTQNGVLNSQSDSGKPNKLYLPDDVFTRAGLMLPSVVDSFVHVIKYLEIACYGHHDPSTIVSDNRREQEQRLDFTRLRNALPRNIQNVIVGRLEGRYLVRHRQLSRMRI